MPEHQEERGKISGAKYDEYNTYLKEMYRPPSRGGNTSALHVHVMAIDGLPYSFVARGSRKWAYVSDTVSFEYVVVKDGKYRNIDKATLETLDKNGTPVVRGDRRQKPTLRTAATRMPASQREQRD